MDVSDYSQKVSLVYVIIDDKFDSFLSSLNNLKNNTGRFVFFSIDVGSSAAFGKKIFEYKDTVNKILGNNYFGIMSAPTSAFIPSEFCLRNYLSETKNKTFFMSGGTSISLEI
jgi:hypothetical protein